MDDEHPEWLPADWKVRVKVRSTGKKDKYYINPDGIKFNSKPEVIRYIENAENDLKLKEPNKTNSQRTAAEKLPPGWTKEIKITRKGGKTRRNPYYIDPVSGHRFRSMQEVNRYLETTKDSGKAESKEDDTNHPTEESIVAEEQRSIDSEEDKMLAGNESIKSEDGAVENSNSLETNAIAQREEKDSVGEDRKQENVTPQNKRKKSNHNGLPRRSSKRLARMETDSTLELNTSNGAREAARPQVDTIENTGKSEPNTCADSGKQKETVHEHEASTKAREAATPLYDAEISTTVKDTSVKSDINISVDFGKQKEVSNVAVRDVSSSEEHEVAAIELKENDKNGKGKDLDSSLNDLLKDPCIEFAIKLLTGAVPIEEVNKVSVASPSQTSGSSSAPSFCAIPIEDVNKVSVASPNQTSGSSSAAPVSNIWADPCFEFAVKTLTSEIPTNALSPLSSSGCNSTSTLKSTVK